MILIFSTDENDHETDLVIKWLLMYNSPFLRININDILSGDFHANHESFQIQNKTYLYLDFKVIWIRRWSFQVSNDQLNDLFDFSSNLELNNFLTEEWKVFCRYFFSKFPKKAWVNDYRYYFVDKLEQLDLAQNVGLKVPKYQLSTNPKMIENLSNTITKPMSNLSYLTSGNNIFANYTSTASNIQQERDSYFISFFQDKIQPQFEIRSMYIFGEFYNCGLFSENKDADDLKLKKDLRINPIRLDKSTNLKLRSLMNNLSCEICFIDLIFDGKDFYFLEINPFGKFYYYSYKCNFNIDHRIALGLISKLNEN